MLRTILDKTPDLDTPYYFSIYNRISEIANWVIGISLIIGVILLIYYLGWLLVEKLMLDPLQNKAITKATDVMKKETKVLLNETSSLGK